MSRDRASATVLHVDMDAFYASVSLRGRPDLAGLPVLVGGGGGSGGQGARGVVLSANYPARRYGITSAMPVGRARRLCPDVVVLAPDHGLYAEVSASVMAVLAALTPVVEQTSPDEAFLDFSVALRRHPSPEAIAHHLRAMVEAEQGITCSVGVSTTKTLAKIASTRAKPAGVLVVPGDRAIAFLHPLPVTALPGVGEVSAATLARLGLRTVADVAHTSEHVLRSVLGDAAGASLAELAWGHDPRPVRATGGADTTSGAGSGSVGPGGAGGAPGGGGARSTGAAQTFGRDVADPEVVRRELLGLCERTTARLRATRRAGRTVVLTVRFSDFTTITRSRTLPEATDVSRDVHAAAIGLWEALGLQRARVRLVGVRVEGLVDAASVHHQTVLGERASGWREADRAVDVATARFGRGAVRRATLVGGR